MKYIWIILFSLYTLAGQAQEKKELVVKPTISPIVIDGYLAKEEWETHIPVGAFIPNFPNNESSLAAQTNVKVTYDKRYIYISSRMEVPENFDGYNIQSLRRDFNLLNNEAFLITIDTYSDYTNGYYFEVTPYGNQGEFLASNSGRFGGVKSSWDQVWESSVQIDDKGWTVEVAIPFRILGFDSNNKSWRMNFIRIDNTNNQYSSWVKVPRNFDVWDLNFSGEIIWQKDLSKTTLRPNIIPSLTFINNEDRISDDISYSLKPSLDVKANVSSSLNLDITVNPDFSQTEVDQQQLNVGRFELFFPEKRAFFIENEDLFSSFGFVPVRPFFSRRIGLSFDSETGTFKDNPILGGVRLSGKVNEKLRVGLMTIQTQENERFFQSINGAGENLPSINYTVLSLQKQVFEKSNLKLLFVNKQLSKPSSQTSDYNRVLATHYNFTNKKGNYYGWVFGSKSFSPGIRKSDYAYGSSMVYNSRKWLVLWSGRQVMRNYNAETGFVPRKDVIEIFSNPSYRIYPKGVLAENRFGISSTVFLDGALKNIERRTGFFSQSIFNNGHSIRIQFNTDYTLLRNDFDPSGKNSVRLRAGTDYSYQYGTVSFESNQRDALWFNFSASAGSYFNGKRYELGTTLNYRLQPYINFSVLYKRSIVDLPEPFSSSSFNVVTPQIEASLNKSLFITLVSQYNEQFDNLSSNVRFQWRFNSVSSMNLIYVNNTGSNDWNLKQQSVSMKIIYWL